MLDNNGQQMNQGGCSDLKDQDVQRRPVASQCDPDTLPHESHVPLLFHAYPLAGNALSTEVVLAVPRANPVPAEPPRKLLCPRVSSWHTNTSRLFSH